MSKQAVRRLTYTISIVISIVIMIICILAGKASNFHPNNSPIMPFIGLAFPYLLLLNLFIMIIWIIRLKIWFIIPTIALIIGYFHIQPIYYPSFLHKNNEKGNFRIASYNVAAFNSPTSDYDAKELAKFMKNEKIDVICMQEFIGNENLTDSLLFSIFSNWPYHYIPDSSKDIIRPAIFSKYPISQTRLITFKNSKNCALLCDINVKGKYIRIFNNHLQTTDLTQIKEKDNNDMAHKEFYYQLKIQALQHNSLIRAQQADIIHSLVQQSSYPVIICGDFNDSPFSYTYKAMLGNLKDGFITNGEGYASTYRYANKIFRIDYIFYSEPLKGTQYYIPKFGESDHYPVIMELKI